MNTGLLKKLIPKSVKEWIKANPKLENLIDTLMHGKREIVVFNDIKGMMGADEREHLFRLAKNLEKGSTIVEIGCFAGLSTYFLGKGAQISQSKVYSIDPFNHEIVRQIKDGDSSWYLKQIAGKPSLKSVQETMKKHKLEDRITLIEGFGQEVASRWNHGKVNFLWIDGNHLEAYGDFKAWEKHLTDKAIVAFHDSVGARAFPQVAKDVKKILQEEKVTMLNHCRTITTIILDRQTNRNLEEVTA
jgi:predicted O-methyltransferase YrrM